MPRNVSGTYTLPAGNPVVSGTTIQASWANTTLTDLATAMSDSLSRSGNGGMSAALIGIQGSAAAPAFAFTGDTSTGIYRAAAGVLGFAAGGQNRMALGTTGNLSLGNTTLSPGTTLAINRNLVGPVIGFGVLHDSIVQSDVTGAANLFMTQARTAAASFTLTQLNHFRANQVTLGAGSVLSEQNGFIVDSTLIGATVNIGFRGVIPQGTSRWNLYMDGTAWNHLLGVVLHGTLTQRDGTHLTCVSPGTSSAAGFYITGDNSVNRDVVWIGTTVNGASGAIRLNGFTISLANVSDHRRKENIRSVIDAETRLAKLRPVEFDWKGNDLPRQRGFLAHEFAEVYPHAVSGEKDAVGEDGQPAYQMMSDAVVIPDLVSAVKSLLSRVAQLEAA